MATVDLTDPASFVGAFAYEHTDIPPGQTLQDWRRERTRQARAATAARRAARRARLRQLLPRWAPTARQAAPARRVEAAR